MKKYISIILIISCSLMTVACAGVQVPVRAASDLRNVKPDNQYAYSYKITFVSGESHTVDDEDLNVANGTIGIRFSDDQNFRYYAPDQIQRIERKIKRRTGMGALIGLGAGAAVGTTLGFLGARGGCENADDQGDCEVMGKILGVIGGVGIAALGTIIGAVVGANIEQKKKKKIDVTVSPQLYGDKGVKITGGGLGVSGSF